jgi:Uncharacterised nucleotidyltransferase
MSGTVEEVDRQVSAGYLHVASAATLGTPVDLVTALSRLPDAPAAAALTLRQHQLIRLVLDRLHAAQADGKIDSALLEAMRAQRGRASIDAGTFLAVFDDLRTRLEAASEEVLLLKGLYLAQRLYGGIDRRSQFDLDVLVHPRAMRLTGRILKTMAFARETYDLHSVTYRRDNLKVDIHGWLRRAPAYRLSETEIWRTARPVRLANVDVPTLSDEYTLVLMALSNFEDLGQGAARIRQLLDVYLLLRAMDAATDWGRFFARRKTERIDRILAHILGIAVALFDADRELPRLVAALESRAELGAPDRSQAVALLFAPRKAPANLAWFRDVYPGPLLPYLLSFWWGSFPKNLGDLDRARLRAAAKALFTSDRS